jgi:hypothetical protein
MWATKAPAAMLGPAGERSCIRSWRRCWLRLLPGICLTLSSAGPLAAGPAGALPGMHRAPVIAASFLSAAEPEPQGTDGTGTMTVLPISVPASGIVTLTFTYKAAAQLKGGSVTLEVPPGWTPPSQAPGPGGISTDCSGCTPSVVGRQIMVAGIDLSAGNAFTITYSGATAPGSAASYPFDVSEQSTTPGAPKALRSTPVVTVTCTDGTGAVVVSPGTVITSSTSTLVFTYTAAGVCGVQDGVVTVEVPPGWTPPSATAGTAGYATSSLGPQSLAVSGATITVRAVTLAPGQALTITYGAATAPGSATTSTFTSSEQSTDAGTLTPLPSSPPVVVQPSPSPSVTTSPSSPATGTGGPGPGHTPAGTMTVSPGTVVSSHPGTLIFTYGAGAAGLAPSGEVTLTVPPGWTPPSRAPGTAGYTTSRPGVPSVSGRRITVTRITLSPGQSITITYRPARAPRAAGTSVFPAFERPAAAGTLVALAISPSVTVAGPSSARPPILLILILLTAGAAAVLSAIQFLRHRPQPAITPSVQAVPHTGPPGAVSIQHSGTDATQTVRIEPRPGVAVTTIEETRP